MHHPLNKHDAVLLRSSEAGGKLLARILRGHALPALTYGSEGTIEQGEAYRPVESSPEGRESLMQAAAGGLLSWLLCFRCS